jgi:hypothetical protein
VIETPTFQRQADAIMVYAKAERSSVKPKDIKRS